MAKKNENNATENVTVETPKKKQKKLDVNAETEVANDFKKDDVKKQESKPSDSEEKTDVKAKAKKPKKPQPSIEQTSIKKHPEKIVEEIIKHNNLPVLEEAENSKSFIHLEEKKPEVKPKKISKKEEEAIREKIIKQKILEEDTASYVQICKEKRKSRKIVRYKPNPLRGLPTEIVEHRNAQGLTNEKPKAKTKTIPGIIFSNIFTFFNLLNFAIAAWLFATFGISGWNRVFFIVIVTANLIISIVQEIRSKKIIEKLSVLSSPHAVVVRDGVEVEIDVNEVVLDDILCLSSGNQIVSDAILVEGGIEVNEALLTGEADAISKKVGDVLYSGSFVVSGNCKARVERVGKDNHIEKLTSQAKKYQKPKSELLKTLTVLIRVIAILIIPLGTLVFMSQWEGANWGGNLEYADAVGRTAGAVIGMIPSGLFLLTSVALAVGVIRLAQNNTLVQELYCIEMLARVDVLCLDKTGTITDGSMSVKNVIEFSNNTGLNVKNAYSAMQNVLNDTNVTSQALEEKFGRAKRIKHLAFIPFNSARKFSAVEFEKFGTFILGAPEFVLTDNYSMVAGEVNKAAKNGYRVLCMAHSDGSIVDGNIEGYVSPIALILIEDTIRPDAIETINYFKQSGVEVKVISGDNPLTVSKISERAGIENADQYISLDGLSDKEVIRAADKYTVFGRVSPAQKKLLVATLKEQGKTVAMTGDGVNDILALKEADCSISLASGSEAARNVSHLVLLDSNFSSMPKVVAEGRRVINNVQRVASLFLTKTIFSFILAIYCVIIKEYPIETQQLFLIDTFVTGIPSFILALESNNNKVHGRFFVNVLRNALPGAVAIALSTALVFFLSRSNIVNLEPIEVNTIIVLNATFTCFTVLYKVCRPFNVIRRVLITLMIITAVTFALLIPSFFYIVPLAPLTHLSGYMNTLLSDHGINLMSVQGLLLLFCLMQATYPLIRLLENMFPTLKNLTNYFFNFLRKIK